MKKYFIFGVITGLGLAALANIFIRKYYIFPAAHETQVGIDGLRENFTFEQIVAVNEMLDNSPGGRKAVVYPKSGSSYGIVWLPRNKSQMDEDEQKAVSEAIRRNL